MVMRYGCEPSGLQISHAKSIWRRAEPGEGAQGGAARRSSLMRASVCSLVFSCVLSFAVGVTVARAQTYSVLYSFQCGPGDGANPGSKMAVDSAGNLYGTTGAGGAHNLGTVFELSPDRTEALLHNFAGAPTDGETPFYNNVIRDSDGNLYSTTSFGGAHADGTVFAATTSGKEKILYSFGAPQKGIDPVGGLLRDSSGNLYGTTLSGGPRGNGSVFELSRTDVLTVLYEFTDTPDGAAPIGTLIRDSAGNLYGTTQKGGGHGDGSVFELSSAGKETVLHSFSGGPRDGAWPYGGLVLGSGERFYGTTAIGGSSNAGTVFEVTMAGKEEVLHSFSGSPDGSGPYSGLLRAASGSLYGVTYYGGTGSCDDGSGTGCGVLFQFSPQGKETVLYNFGGTPDGANPLGGLAEDSTGNLYGTTFGGGTYGCGTVFKYTP